MNCSQQVTFETFHLTADRHRKVDVVYSQQRKIRTELEREPAGAEEAAGGGNCSGVDLRTGGRRGWNFVLYSLITAGSWLEPAVMVGDLITAGPNGHYSHLLWTRRWWGITTGSFWTVGDSPFAMTSFVVVVWSNTMHMYLNIVTFNSLFTLILLGIYWCASLYFCRRYTNSQGS